MMTASEAKEVEELKEQLRGWKFKAECYAHARNAAAFRLLTVRNHVGEDVWWEATKDIDEDSPQARGLYEVDWN